MNHRIAQGFMHRYRTFLIAAAVVLVLAAGSGAMVGLFTAQGARVPQTAAVGGGAADAAPHPQSPEDAARMPARYIEIIDGCGPYHDGGACVNVRSGPGTDFPAVLKLRTGIVLKVDSVVQGDTHTWYRVVFDEWVRYPDRIGSEWYVAGDFVRLFEDESAGELGDATPPPTEKYILIDRTIQRLFAWDGETLFMELPISTGLDLTPTPRGIFRVYKKTPTRYMQGPLPGISDQYYDLPGVPWNLYFTNEGGAIHGAYWHDKFGSQWSHGCVNLPLDKARQLYGWAELGTKVIVRD